MKCMKCKKDFPENEIQESHDVPVYLFEGKKRNARKNKADKYGRHHLCEKCHKKYEWFVYHKIIDYLPTELKQTIISLIKINSEIYFKKG